jgi:hypothetical protein
MEAIREAIIAVLRQHRPATVRQVFYQLVSMGAIAKTEAEYKQTVGRLLTDMRIERRIPFGWIADNTRWQRKPTTDSSLEAALRRTAELYRRAVWDDQDAYVEIWLEKDALAGVLSEVTREYDVPLMVTRGYPSVSYLYECARDLYTIGMDKEIHIYYFGDRDPSGGDIPRNVEARLREFTDHEPTIHFEVVAVTKEQIAALNLPTRPTKRSDSRAANFDGESVEVDAIPPDTLREMARSCIEQHLDHQRLAAVIAAEESERHILRTYADKYAGGAP